MTAKQLIAFGSLFLIILALIIYIVFKKPVKIIDNSQLDVYKDSITNILKISSDKDIVILKREKYIDSLESIDHKKNIKYYETIKYINNPNIPIRILDSIVRSIILPKK